MNRLTILGEELMNPLVNHPLILLFVLLVVLWLAAVAGVKLRGWRTRLEGDAREDFGVVQTATLTLLALMIGFSFSMAVNRYDQRKNYEEEEANAIGTEFVRAELLPGSDAAKVQFLLKQYLDQRILFYRTRDEGKLGEIDARTTELETGLWTSIKGVAAAQPTPVVALVVSGMNDVLNTQGYTQAAWWNRIPLAAWGLMIVIAMACNVLVGYGTRSFSTKSVLLIVQPLVVAISLALIADIDSPRGGVIRVVPQNLIGLAQSLTPR
jgi:hypothetical protein